MKETKKPQLYAEVFLIGGGGGNRTPVRKSSTQSFYMLSSLFGSRSGYSSEQDFTRTSLSITAYTRDTGYEARSLK